MFIAYVGHLIFGLIIFWNLCRKRFICTCVLLYLYVLLMPELPITRDLPGWRLDIRSVYLAVACVALAKKLFTGVSYHHGWLIGLCCGMWALLSAVMAPVKGEAAQRAVAFLLLLVFAGVITARGGFMGVVHAFLQVGMVVLGWSAVACALGASWCWHETGRFQGVMGNPNGLGATAWMTTCVAALSLRRGQAIRRRVAMIGVLAVSLGCLLASGSRGSTAAAAAVLIIALWGSRIWVVAAVYGCVGLGVALLVHKGVRDVSRDAVEAILRLPPEPTDLNTLFSGREVTAFTIPDSLLGVGLGNADIRHLGYHRCLAELGVPGLALFLTLLLVPIGLTLRILALNNSAVGFSERVALGFLVGYALNTVSENYLVSPMIYPTFGAWAAAMALYRFGSRACVTVQPSVRLRDVHCRAKAWVSCRAVRAAGK